MPAHKVQFERFSATRIVANPDALDNYGGAFEGLALRLAPDELLLLPELDDESAIIGHDPYAVVLAESALFGVWLAEQDALDLLASHCEWAPPKDCPAFAQGLVAGVATKIWFEEGRTLFIVSAPYVHEFEERIA